MKLMSRTIPVPLVANRMVNYVDHHDGFEKQYFPELSLIMQDGFGILNLGVGELASIKCGKSQLVSSLVYSVDSQKSYVYMDEWNVMNSGTVDVSFISNGDTNGYQQKRNLVLMDGQGVQDLSVL